MSVPNGKVISDSEDMQYSSGKTYVNPFVHKLSVDDPIDVIKTYILTIVLLPIRVICIIIFLLIAWLLTCLGLFGIKPEDLKTKPIKGWRLVVKKIAAFSMRTLFAVGTFHYIKFKGKQASPKEAPILVVAPHSSYIDAIVVVVLGPPSIVAKSETAHIPFFGRMINYSQPIYVLREDPNSRQNTIKEIIDRANAEDDWPQIVIFPEGTCTNRLALITFKPGAFYPGVPIQPVLLKYPNKYDTLTWTWDGPGVLKLIWLTLTQIHSYCEIEFLPVYKPSEEEKANGKLYARNVRDVMAKALGVPVSEFSYDDCLIMNKAKDMNIPYAADIVEIERTRKLLKLDESNVEEEIAADYFNIPNDEIDFTVFTKRLNISPNINFSKQLFFLLDIKKSERISLRDYLVCSLFLSRQNHPIILFLRAVTKVYSQTSQCISRDCFNNIVRHTGKISKEKSDNLFFSIDQIHKGSISFDDFEMFVKQKAEFNYLFTKVKCLK